jgi:hypothetical protein
MCCHLRILAQRAAEQEDEMRKRLILAALTIAVASPGAQAQTGAETGVRTETQERLLNKRDSNLPWNVLGLLGLLCLLGLRRGHAEDSYHPAPLD